MPGRFEQALRYARRFSLSLVFALLAPPWVRQAVVAGFVGLLGEVAMILADWKAFGALSVLQRGGSAGRMNVELCKRSIRGVLIYVFRQPRMLQTPSTY